MFNIEVHISHHKDGTPWSLDLAVLPDVDERCSGIDFDFALTPEEAEKLTHQIKSVQNNYDSMQFQAISLSDKRESREEWRVFFSSELSGNTIEYVFEGFNLQFCKHPGYDDRTLLINVDNSDQNNLEMRFSKRDIEDFMAILQGFCAAMALNS